MDLVVSNIYEFLSLKINDYQDLINALSWTTIVVYSRDDQEIDVAHKVKSPKTQPQFSHTTMGQYWLGKTKPKQAFRSTQNAF